MKFDTASLAGLIAAAFAAFALPGAASAASPALCALYGREIAVSKIPQPVSGEAAAEFLRTQDQAFYQCLNMDEAPRFPTTSAYFGQGVAALQGDKQGSTDAVASEVKPASGESDTGFVAPKPVRAKARRIHHSRHHVARRVIHLPESKAIVDQDCATGGACAAKPHFWRGLL